MKLWSRIIPAFIISHWIFICSVIAVTFDEARHLYSRTGFGGDWNDIQSLKLMDYEKAVEHLLNGAHKQPQATPPDWVKDPPLNRKNRKHLSEAERIALRKEVRRRAIDLKAWWVREMIQTDSPLTETMTLFWSNHFTSGLKKVKFPAMMYHQNLLLREHALGNFRQLLHAMAKDPAMIMYLDNVSNVKGKPNENFARELLELFTLGEGHYSEKDIKEAARAFTGWTLNRQSGKYRFARRRHDFGSKTFIGQTGNFNGNDIIEIVLKQPRVAVFITEKIWREFTSETPDPAEVDRMASIFRTNNYEIKPLVQAILTSKYFRDPHNYGTMIKSPVDLMVGTLRMFQVPIGNGYGLVQANRRLGQDLMDPPNVKGWEGGTSWITSDTLLLRQQILNRFLRGKEMTAKGSGKFGKMMTRKNVEDFGKGLSREEIIKLLLPIKPVEPVDSGLSRQELITELLLDPVYQLK